MSGVAGVDWALCREELDVEITDVRVFPVRDEKVCAFVSIVFDQCFMVNDIKVIQGKDGLFVSMPSRKRKSGEFKDVAHPLNSETRKWVENRILGAYRASLDGIVQGESQPASRQSPAPAPAVAAGPAVAGGTNGTRERSLEEVERVQFGDSFWGVT